MAQTFQWLIAACLVGNACAQDNLPIQETFDCQVGAADWRDGWSEAKTSYCCKTTDACCESGTVGADKASPGSKCPLQMDKGGTWTRILGFTMTVYFAFTFVGLLCKSLYMLIAKKEPFSLDGTAGEYMAAQDLSTHGRLIIGNVNFWFGVYAPLTVPLLGSMSADSVFFAHCFFYLLPVIAINLVGMIYAVVLLYVQPAGDVRGVGPVNLNVGATNLMPMEVEGTVKTSQTGTLMLEAGRTKIPLINYPAGAQDGDRIYATLNYPTLVPTNVRPEFAAYRATKASAACPGLDKILLFLRSWTALWALSCLPKTTCGLFGSSTPEYFPFVLESIQFAFTLTDMLSAANFWTFLFPGEDNDGNTGGDDK